MSSQVNFCLVTMATQRKATAPILGMEIEEPQDIVQLPPLTGTMEIADRPQFMEIVRLSQKTKLSNVISTLADVAQRISREVYVGKLGISQQDMYDNFSKPMNDVITFFNKRLAEIMNENYYLRKKRARSATGGKKRRSRSRRSRGTRGSKKPSRR